MSKVTFSDILRGYEKRGEVSGGSRFATKRISGTAAIQTSRTSRRFRDAMERIANCLTVTSTRTYGLFLLTFGIVTLLLHFVKDYLDFYETVPLSTLIIGGAFLLVGIPLIAFDKPLAFAIEEFPLTEFIFIEFFCLPVAHKKVLASRTIPPVVGLLLGLLLAALGAVVPLIYVALVIIAAVYIHLAMLAPEFSYYCTLLLMPYLSPLGEWGGIVLASLVLVTAISFVRKVVAGKRVFSLEQYDVALFVMLIFVLISGIFVKGMESFTSSLVLIALGMGYSLTSSIITNRRLADGLVKAVIASSVPVSVIAIYEAVVGILKNGFADFDGASATFGSSDSLGIFLLISLFFSAYFIASRRQRSTKAFYSFIFALNLAALLSTMRVWVLIAALVGAIAYAATKLQRGSGFTIALLSLLPYGLLFLPSSWLNAIVEAPFAPFLGLDEIIPVWINSRRMLIDNVFSGVGIGSESFMAEYSKYSYSASLPTNSGNFLLEIGCEAGIFALLMLVIIFGVRLGHRSAYSTYIRGSQHVLINRFSTVAIVVLFVYGLLTSLWSDMTMYFLFWVVFGLGSAVLRVSRQEHDDLASYYHDGAGQDSSAIDITLR